MGLDEVNRVLESSGQDSHWQGAVTSSKLTSQVHALLKVTELKINMEPVIAFPLDVLYYMFHTLNSFALLLYSSVSFRTNTEVRGRKKKAKSSLPSTHPILSEWLTSTGTINLNQDGMPVERRHPKQSPWVPETWWSKQLLPLGCSGGSLELSGCFKNSILQN